MHELGEKCTGLRLVDSLSLLYVQEAEDAEHHVDPDGYVPSTPSPVVPELTDRRHSGVFDPTAGGSLFETFQGFVRSESMSEQ